MQSRIAAYQEIFGDAMATALEVTQQTLANVISGVAQTGRLNVETLQGTTNSLTKLNCIAAAISDSASICSAHY